MAYLVDDRRKLWRADLADLEPRVERRNTVFALPPGKRAARLFLVESLRHVHLVLADEHHSRIALFRLDWDRRMWVLDCLCGDCMLLLGRGCSAVGRLPGTVLFVHQPSFSLIDVGVDRGGGGGHVWFWAESRVYAGQDDVLVLKKTVQH